MLLTKKNIVFRLLMFEKKKNKVHDGCTLHRHYEQLFKKEGTKTSIRDPTSIRDDVFQ